jgi:ribose transport system ATP-binding protein
VSFSVNPGEVHVLLGENGAGKSTLMKILSGVYTKDSGEIRIQGNQVDFYNVKDAMQHGIRIIYQELNLLNNLTVAENIFIGEEPRVSGVINWKKMFEDSQELLRSLNLSIDSHQKVSELPVGEQQMVEVVHAVSKDAKVIVMDEPTSALSSKEIKDLFTTIRALKNRGVGVVYISHRLEELLEIGDRVTVFRDGEYIGTKSVRDTDGNISINLNDLITMMVGRSLDQQYPKDSFVRGEETLRIEDIRTESKLRGCSISLYKGEILGLAGLMGAGRTELARAVIGADRITGGTVYQNGKALKIRNPGDAIAQGIGYLPEDRKLHGLVLDLDVAKNVTLAGIKRIIKKFSLSLKAEQTETDQLVKDLRIKTPSINQKVQFLSGGNQQKVVVAKWLFANSDILIFDEPTRGIDVGAKVEIYRLLNRLVKDGKTVMIISSELPEILGMCDRIAIMRDGLIVKEFMREEASQDAILKYALGAET